MSSWAPALAMVLVCALSMLCGATSAYAVSHADPTPDKKLAAAQDKVEKSAAAFDEADRAIRQLEKRIKENQKRLAEVKAEIPEQKTQARLAFRILYKTSQDAPGMIDMLISAGSVKEFFDTYEYLQHIQDSSVNSIERLTSLEEELTATKKQLKEDKKKADEERDKAYVALEQAKAERQKIQDDAIAAAEAEARAQAAKEKKEREAAEKKKQQEQKKQKEIKPITKGDVNWDMSKAKFVSIWTKRINAYLKGSPLAGQGKRFANAAWKYGVDPRWSPAISCIESSKGAHCFKPHNAWGWGSVSWKSWSEAIDAHVHGLARGYGYTISITAAQKYCPPNWRNWYDKVSAQMKKI